MSNHETNITQIPIEENFVKYLNCPHQNFQGHQKQERSEKWSQPNGVYGDLTTKCVLNGILEQTKGIVEGNEKIYLKYRL